ncbi:FtsX-like permease family protein [Staphylococcus pettenkoferi]|uniref:FtsX-like permease family protein n=1 Tax=Staphylococcus pettenkoferi TaxID=170573 RepID=UPI00066D4664|nr:ABC transporter permease [Staphylococcus pettenkoferi]MCY1567335.1 ABC transporter permease [Staphylococcus pettenkoferi]MDK7114779.1 ABC transporter permease [Staphylococcus pettenkoferi]MDK7283579.1 ABC transporter permease [Staphylococcus pettenkoferi]
MTFNQITLKNLRKNIKHYGMFLFSLLLSIVIYYSFTTLKYSHSINNSGSMDIIKKGAVFGSTVLFIIIIVFLMYANHLFVKRRTKEFALFQLIGLSRGNILRMLSLEQFMIFIVTGIVGVIIGIFGSQLALNIAMKLMKLKTHIAIGFEPQALVITVIMLAIAFLLILIQNALFLKRRSILTMIKDSTKTETTKARITIPEVIGGILGIAMIALGYYMATEMSGKFKELTKMMVTPCIIIFLTVVGSYLFFRSSVSLIFKTVKKAKNGRISITDVVCTSSIMHRMKKNSLSLTIIAVISAFTVAILCFAVITKSQTDYNMQTMAPQDFNIEKGKQAQQFEKKLNQAHISFNKKTTESISPKIIKDEVMTMGNDTHTPFTPTIVKNPRLRGNDAKLTNTKTTSGTVDFHINKNITVKGATKKTVKVTHRDDDKVYPFNLSNSMPVIQVSPEVYYAVKTDKISQHAYGFNLKNHSNMKKAENIAQKINPYIVSKDTMKKQMDASNGILIFVTSFLGLAFLIAAGCIIYIKQVDETEDESDNFKILRRIGFTSSDMAKGLALKILFNFGLPLVVALLHAFFAATAFMKLMGNVTMKPVFTVMIIYTVIYFVFALIAFIHSNRVIKKSI